MDSGGSRVDSAMREVGFRGIGARLRALPAAPATIPLTALLAVLCVSPALTVGWRMDDHIHRAVFAGTPEFPDLFQSRLDLFSFLDGDEKRTHELVDIGVLPWWTKMDVRLSFWRPLSSLTHFLDYALWPRSPALMHAHSLLWYGLLVAAVGVAFRRFGELTQGEVLGRVPAVAVGALATVMYALDDAHGFPVSWIANRNAVIGSVFAVAVLLMHDRARRGAGWKAAAATPLLLLAGLLAAEAAIGAMAYLIAYAACLDRAPVRIRLASLAPSLAVVVVWRLAYNAQGYGAYGTGYYLDPVREPLRYAGEAMLRAPVLLLGQWAWPPAEIYQYAPLHTVRYVVALGVLLVCLLGLLLYPLLRASRLARFWALGMLLSLGPVTATYPSNRLLLLVGIGAMWLAAAVVCGVVGKAPWLPAGRMARGATALGALAAALFHGVIGPIGLPGAARTPLRMAPLVEDAIATLPADAALARETLVVARAPMGHYAGFIQIVRLLEDNPRPRRTRWLASGATGVVLTRIDERTIRARAAASFINSPSDLLFRGADFAVRAGERVRLTDTVIDVTQVTADGRPLEATFTFGSNLDGPHYRWVTWERGRYVPFAPPRPGQSVTLGS
ncbi:MAG: hypothetical protein HYV63_12945 [Candidatus Schekmanbacteria bacterium]|nr:hypothetical protein [Candidatus Schekmanbacteria bacterium]